MGEPEAKRAAQSAARLFVGARFRTLAPGSSGEADCLAADSAGRILAVGDRATVQRRWLGDRTEVVDFGGGGAAAVPGFVESHVHLILAGEAEHARSVNCSPHANASASDVLRRLRAAAERTPREPDAEGLLPFVVGWGYDDVIFGRTLTRDDLDFPSGACVLVWHISLHTVYVSSAALAAGGISDATPQPTGGVIVRDAAGRCTGELQESPAFAPVRSRMARGPGSSQRDASVLREAAWAAARVWSARGMTTVHDMLVSGAKVDALNSVTRDPEWPLRVVLYTSADARGGRLRVDALPQTHHPGTVLNPMLRVAGVKLIADGAMLVRSCYMREPYLSAAGATAPAGRGDMVTPPEVLAAEVAAAERRGWSVAVHCNGDAALDHFLAAVRAARRIPLPGAAARPKHRVEHLQVAHPEQVQEMRELGINASIFPGHLHQWGDYEAAKILGEARAHAMYSAALAEKCGVLYGLHSDAPVTPADPLLSMWAAVTRKGQSGAVLGPEHRITARSALRALTIDAAALAGEEADKGSLEVGKLCDITVLSEDPLGDAVAQDPDRLRRAEVLYTVMGGKVVHRKSR